MLHIFFDNNALQALCFDRDCACKTRAVQEFQQDGALQVHFNFFNFCEPLVGVYPDNFAERQKLLRYSLGLCDYRLLLRPMVHLRQVSGLPSWFDSWTEEQITNDAKPWTALMDVLERCHSYDDARQFALPLMDAIENEKSRRLSSWKAIQEEMFRARKVATSRDQKKVFTTDSEALSVLKRRLFDSKVRDYQLIRSGYTLGEAEQHVLHRELPSLLYYTDVYLENVSRLFYGRRYPELGDQFDFEQVLYLDTMDYFITRDTELRGLADTCGNSGLVGRLRSLDELVDACQQPVFDWHNRAPKKIDREMSFES